MTDGPHAPEPYSNWAPWGPKDQAQWEGLNSYQAGLHGLKATFDGYIKEWLADQDTSLGALIELEDSEFEEKLNELLRNVTEQLQAPREP